MEGKADPFNLSGMSPSRILDLIPFKKSKTTPPDYVKFALAMLEDADLLLCVLDFLPLSDIAMLAMVSRYFREALKGYVKALSGNIEQRADFLGRLDAAQKRTYLRVCFACGKYHIWLESLQAAIGSNSVWFKWTKWIHVPCNDIRKCQTLHKQITFGRNAYLLGRNVQLVMRRLDRGWRHGLHISCLRTKSFRGQWTHSTKPVFDRKSGLIVRVFSYATISHLQPPAVQTIVTPAAFRQSIWNDGLRGSLCLCNSEDFVSMVLHDCDAILRCAEDCVRRVRSCVLTEWAAIHGVCPHARLRDRECSTCFTVCRVQLEDDGVAHTLWMTRYYDTGPAFTHSRFVPNLRGDKRLRQCGYKASSAGFLRYMGPKGASEYKNVVERFLHPA